MSDMTGTPAFKALQSMYEHSMKAHKDYNRQASELAAEVKSFSDLAYQAELESTSYMEALIKLSKT